MVGIYKITNLTNGKIYIGQSIHIERRFLEHKCYGKTLCHESYSALHRAINKYGWESFKCEILEECSESELNEKEIYYISFYKSNKKGIGYNLTEGGDKDPGLVGIDSPKSVLNEECVKFIRECYANHLYKHECFELVSQMWLINKHTFHDVWRGKTYKNICPEVFTPENKQWHKFNQNFNRNHCSKVKEYVLPIRQLKKEGYKKSDVYKQYSFINFNTFHDIWQGNTFKNIQP